MTGAAEGRVVVVGSANADLVLSVARIPRPGETVLGGTVTRGLGGKGANQAIAAARAGATVEFVGAVGADDDGAMVRAGLDAAGVSRAALLTGAAPTGLAVVTVEESGENAIVVASGANALLTAADLPTAVVGDAAVLVLQLEIPVDTVLAAARLCGGTVLLNAAPARDLPDALWDAVDLLVVNEQEAAALGDALHRVPEVVITLGAAGAVHRVRGTADRRIAAAPARAVDTTGAGDTYVGVLAAGIAAGLDRATALHRAAVAAAISVERPGAAASSPTAAEIDTRVAGHSTRTVARPD